MAQQIITLNENRGSFLFDTSTSSTVQIPSAFCVDLRGCGGQTHQSGSASATYNSRVECSAPARALQFSQSGFSALNNTVPNLAGYAGTILGVDVDVDFESVATLLVNTITSPSGPASYALALGVPEANLKARGGSYIVTPPAGSRQSNRIVAQVQRVQAYQTLDACKRPEGRTASTSVSVTGFDTSDCSETLLFQMSLSIFASYELYGNPIDPTQLAADITAANFVGLLTTTAATCADIQETVEAGWLTFLNNPVTIGVAVNPDA
jgi:hypothetical protein